MASARANSRVPQPRHLCIIMLRPPLLPRTPQAPLLPPEREVCPPSSHPPPPYFASRPSSASFSSSSSSSFSPHPRAFSLPSRRCTPIRQTGREDRHPRTRRENVRKRLTRVRTYLRMFVRMYARMYAYMHVRMYACMHARMYEHVYEKRRGEVENVFSRKVGESEKVKDGERQREDRYSWIVEGAKGLSAPCLPGINHGISDAQPLSTRRSREKHLLRKLAILFPMLLPSFRFEAAPHPSHRDCARLDFS